MVLSIQELESVAPRQSAVLEFIRRFVASKGYSPSLTEICTEFGFASPRSAAELVEKLEARGMIAREHGMRRGIRVLVEDPARELRHRLPLVGRIAAGAPVLSAEHIDDYVTVDPEAFRPRAHFLRRIQGWSMRDAGIFDGDLVGIHLTPEASPRQIAAVRIEDPQTGELTLTLKRIRKEGRHLVLLSENADQERYPPIRLDPRKNAFAIEGVYVGLIRPAGNLGR